MSLLLLFPASSASGAVEASATRPVLDGRWSIQFRTISNRGFTTPKVGSKRTRTWLFERRCIGGRCGVVVRRETTPGYVTLKLRRDGGVYAAVWRTRADCRSGKGTFLYSERITFTVSAAVVRGQRRLASRISGRLIGRSPKGGCQRAVGRALDRIRGRRTDLPEPPEAAFDVFPARLSVTNGGGIAYFTDRSRDDGEVARHQWDFGDSASGIANHSTDPNPTHAYTTPGLYRVVLTVTDDEGLTGLDPGGVVRLLTLGVK
jgi:uncharacterized membrane protein